MLRTIVDRAVMKALRAEHLTWILDQEQAGTLFLSGPLTGGETATGIAGMTVLRAGSLEEARALADGEPFITSGAMTYELVEWTIFEGTLPFTLTISRGEFTVA